MRTDDLPITTASRWSSPPQASRSGRRRPINLSVITAKTSRRAPRGQSRTPREAGRLTVHVSWQQRRFPSIDMRGFGVSGTHNTLGWRWARVDEIDLSGMHGRRWFCAVAIERIENSARRRQRPPTAGRDRRRDSHNHGAPAPGTRKRTVGGRVGLKHSRRIVSGTVSAAASGSVSRQHLESRYGETTESPDEAPRIARSGARRHFRSSLRTIRASAPGRAPRQRARA